MRIAHIIMAHKGPEQLLRLIERLWHPKFDFYIHVDAKVQLDKFEFLNSHKQIFFIKNRTHCNWGGWSFTKAIISAVNEVINTGTEYCFYNLLSGQDYPLKSADEIYLYLKAEKNYSFIYYAPENSSWWDDAAKRYESYHLTDLNFPGKYFVQKIVNAVTRKREFPNGMKLYGGSNASWWTISGECAKYVVGQVSAHSRLDRFLKYCWGTDEFVITTIIMNSPFKEKSVNENFRYIDWSEGGGHPRILGVKDFEKLMNSGMMFARKFDSERDSKILDLIDQHLVLERQ